MSAMSAKSAVRRGAKFAAAVVVGVGIVAACPGCGDDDDDDAVIIDARVVDAASDAGVDASRATATAILAPRASNKTLRATAIFRHVAGGVQLDLEVRGAPPGPHGVHIHAVGDCTAPDAMSAGADWNPDLAQHGSPGAISHLGDLGNLTVRKDGTGSLVMTSTRWRLGDGSSYDVVGKSLIFHLNPDDLTSQPAGNAGPRIGCGVVLAPQTQI